ncbi:hypothetical protein MMC22_004114 [Lobaria immixta]|nr:hypothetical protein [Lobaria immixta]
MLMPELCQGVIHAVEKGDKAMGKAEAKALRKRYEEAQELLDNARRAAGDEVMDTIEAMRCCSNSCQQHQFQPLLQGHQLDDDVKKALAVMLSVNNTTADAAIDDVVDENETEQAEDVNSDENEEIADVNDYIDDFVQSEHEGTVGQHDLWTK